MLPSQVKPRFPASSFRNWLPYPSEVGQFGKRGWTTWMTACDGDGGGDGDRKVEHVLARGSRGNVIEPVTYGSQICNCGITMALSCHRWGMFCRPWTQGIYVIPPWRDSNTSPSSRVPYRVCRPPLIATLAASDRWYRPKFESVLFVTEIMMIIGIRL